MQTVRDLDIVRAVLPSTELRAAAEGDDTLGNLYGHFSVFDSWYRISSWWEGDFMESVAPGAFRKTMDERRNQIVVNFDHGFDPQIGDKVLGPIDDLREDSTGAFYEVSLLDTTYNRDLLPALRRSLYGASFRFQVIRDEWNDEPGVSERNPEGIPERTIREVRLFEFGPVTYPASAAATAGMRSVCGLTDTYYERLRSANPRRYADAEARTRSIRTPDVDAAPAGTSTDGAANPPTDAPARQGHPGGLTPKQRRESLYAFLGGN